MSAPNFEKAERRCKLQVVKNKSSSNVYLKPLINLPTKVLQYFSKGQSFNVFINSRAIILTPEESLDFINVSTSKQDSLAKELLDTLVRLFIKAYKNPEIAPILKAMPETAKVLQLIKLIRSRSE